PLTEPFATTEVASFGQEYPHLVPDLLHDVVDRVGDVDGRGHADEHDRGDDVRPCRGVLRAGAPVPPLDGGDRLLGLHGQVEGVAVVGLGGVAEDYLPQVGPPVVALLEVALPRAADDLHRAADRVRDALGRCPALCVRFG